MVLVWLGFLGVPSVAAALFAVVVRVAWIGEAEWLGETGGSPPGRGPF